ncbi:MAG: hypothetical protein ACI4HO_08745 [Ruminococcus sp.]
MSTKKQTPTARAKEPEPEYSVEEFKAAPHVFGGTAPDIVTAALNGAGVKTLTKSAAEKIIEEYKTKEV